MSLDKVTRFLPFSYTRIPPLLRNSLSFLVSLPDEHEIEMPRTLLGSNFRVSSKTPLLLTHDVDTSWGYKSGVDVLRDIERKFDWPSAFFFVAKSAQYKLRNHDLSRLIDEGCEIGSHELYHDGKISFVNPHEKARRIRESKTIIESLTGIDVIGFRLPWMTYFPRLFEDLELARYRYDMSLFGIKTILPYRAMGRTVLEFPLTVPSDFYLLNHKRLSREAFLKTWKSRLGFLHANNGLAVIVAHPDRYDLGGRPELYQQFLAYIKDQEYNYEVILPSELLKRLTENNS